jgi:hypothetical protein
MRKDGRCICDGYGVNALLLSQLDHLLGEFVEINMAVCIDEG